MRILELSSNKSSFHPIVFNSSGISIIAAIKETDDQRKTYNSVGKSLSITLIHFCLGSNSNSEISEKLADWNFTLKFQIQDRIFIATREVSNSKYVTLNDNLLTNEDYKDFLEKEVFRIPEGTKFITFRGLISRFIRQRKASYVSYDSYIQEESNNPVVTLLNNGFLLGLDTNRILKKYELKESLDKVNELKKQLSNPEFKSLFQSEKDEDIEITIVDLERRITDLKFSLSKFKVAEDYEQVTNEADEVSRVLKQLKNRETKINIAINDIDRSLELKPDITKEQIISLYNEAKLQLGDQVIKKARGSENFNTQLFDNRAKNLLEEKAKFQGELRDVKSSIKTFGFKKDSLLKYLGSHGALDEFTKMNQLLADYEKRLERLSNYKKILNEYKIKVQELKKEFSDENISTNKYLSDSESIIKKNILLFKSFTERFYQDKSSGITVDNNEKVNKVRFDIKAKIEDDAGDAVNEVKIFCFDWTLLKGQYNHDVKFIFHDSRITDGMDTRQIKTIFQVADEECKRGRFQYIISLNQNVIDGLREEFTGSEFDELIQSNIVLQLSDKSPEDKLLGIQIDLDYDQ